MRQYSNVIAAYSIMIVLIILVGVFVHRLFSLSSNEYVQKQKCGTYKNNIVLVLIH